MKKILILIFALLALQVGAQNTIDHLGKIRMRYNNSGSNDTLLIQFSGDSVLYDANNPFHKFAGGVIMDSIKLNGVWETSFAGSQWTTSGSNIYYNTGNVGINNSSPSYKLDVGGLIGGSNIETNTTSLSTKLGYNAGGSENDTAPRDHVFNGYAAGSSTTTGKQNVFSGFQSGANNTIGGQNVFIGYQSGIANTNGAYNIIAGSGAGLLHTEGNYNVILGANCGSSLTTGSNNTLLGTFSGGVSTGENNIHIGYASGNYTNKSNRLIIHSLDTGSESADSTKSIIYGVMNADTSKQKLNVNGRVYSYGTYAEIYYSGSGTVTQSIPTGTTPTKVTAFNTNSYYYDCTPDQANDQIKITKHGKYKVTLNLSYSSGTTNVTWTAYIFGKGSEMLNIHSTDNASTANQIRSTSLSGIIDANNLPFSVDYRVTHDNPGSVDLNFRYCSLIVEYLGETQEIIY